MNCSRFFKLHLWGPVSQVHKSQILHGTAIYADQLGWWTKGGLAGAAVLWQSRSGSNTSAKPANRGRARLHAFAHTFPKHRLPLGPCLHHERAGFPPGPDTAGCPVWKPIVWGCVG